MEAGGVSDSGGSGVSFLVVAQAVPVEVSGTNIVVRRLLENFGGHEVVLLARPANRRASLDAEGFHYPVVRVHAPPLGWRGERFTRLASVVPGVLQGWGAVRRYRPAAILALFPDECSILIGYILKRLTGVPLFAYFCDLYAEDRRPGTWEGRMAGWLQPRVFAAARRLIAVNEGMADFYRKRYGMDTACLPTCINQPIPDYAPPPEPGRPFRIGYSGNVNATRVGSLRALVAAIGRDPGYSLCYFTPQTPAYLESLGVWAPNASARFVADEASLIPLLAECDALFLPLTFDRDTVSTDQLATCFGIKSYEYFLARRPIVVHTPRDYFLARFYRERGCGLVVDDPGSEALLAAFGRIRENRSLREDLVRQGLAAARPFEGPRIADALRREMLALNESTREGTP
jgi:hypothetical protein